MQLVGYAADGFPIYARYGYADPEDTESETVKMQSGYRLKKGTRPSGPRGKYDGTFVQDFEFVPNGEVVAVASRAQESADAFAGQYDIPRAYSAYQQLLEDPEVDAVYIATPHTLHYQNAIDAVDVGLPGIC